MRQLNAEFGPIECFNQGTLNLLPTQLIVFGKLISNNQQQQNYNNVDTIHIYPNGIHPWSPELENYIWKHLGWDNWSDFTLCSVTCGKGVQQRFRRCLLDNISSSSSSLSFLSVPSTSSAAIYQLRPINFVNNNNDNNNNNNLNKNFINNNQTGTKKFNILQQSKEQQSQQQQQQQLNSKDLINNYQQKISSELSSSSAGYGLHNEFHINFENNESFIKHKNKMINGRKLKLLINKKNHKKKTTKGMTTLSCEGYNIEQRNCNMFDCDDYLTDLLKFLRRTQNEPIIPQISTSIASTSTLTSSSSSETNFDQTKQFLSSSSTNGPLSYSTSGVKLQNSGFIQGWLNSINFTIMITLKLKAPRQSTIFELRNSTHNLYLDQSENGLKLFQERDEVTEMLPIKFDLYDNRWHQIAISIFNGDFITVYVDCIWTNSFVVSKHLIALPLNADVEIGREYAGDEIQQLLILPGNREKQQCSAERTSINEVKRYIIDTFIEDYGN